MKKLLALFTVLALTVSLMPLALAGEAPYTEKEVPVISNDRECGPITLRFYSDRPHVPYFGFKAYNDFVGLNPMTFETDENGLGVFTSAQGVKACVDAEKGTFTTDNWASFRNAPLPYEGGAVGLKDSACAYVRVSDVTYEGDPAPVTLDFAAYGLKLYAEEDDVYMPLGVISTMMNDIATWSMSWNGESVYFGRLDLKDTLPAGYMDSPAMQALMNGGEREADIAEETYGELMFLVDNFFGHPGKAYLDKAIAEKGLEQALLDEGGPVAKLAEGLKSTDFPTYFSSMLNTFMYALDDGHTSPAFMSLLLTDFLTGKYPALAQQVLPAVMELFSTSFAYNVALLSQSISPVRQALWGTDFYREYGNTAVISIDGFIPDEKGWAAYYAGEGELPMDAVGITAVSLKKAASNPEIRNVIFDLTCNAGGSSDMLAYIMAVTTGGNHLYGIEKLTGQRMTATYETDCNLDGMIDEKDKDAVYTQFNYGVLTTRMAFSCGNLFPFMLQEGGAVLIGEPTNGGSCCVQMCSLSDGFNCIISSSQWQLTDAEGVSVEGGCKIDLPIECPEHVVTDPESGMQVTIRDYSAYFDLETLDQMMNVWFDEEALAPAA